MIIEWFPRLPIVVLFYRRNHACLTVSFPPYPFRTNLPLVWPPMNLRIVLPTELLTLAPSSRYEKWLKYLTLLTCTVSIVYTYYINSVSLSLRPNSPSFDNLPFPPFSLSVSLCYCVFLLYFSFFFFSFFFSPTVIHSILNLIWLLQKVKTTCEMFIKQVQTCLCLLIYLLYDW